MTISGIAEKILLELESLGINSESLRNDISELIDLAFEAQNQYFRKEESEKELQLEIERLLCQLGNKQKQIQRIQKQIITDFDRIELQLYEKNEYKLLKDAIDFVKATKQNYQRNQSFCENSQISQPNPNEDAFYCSNSMNIQNNFLHFQQENQKFNEILQTINKSNVSLSQKEQLVYNIIKSQTNQSPLQHVNLEDILDVSYHPNSKKINTSILSSIPIQNNESSVNKFNQKGKLFDSKVEFTPSPKFQFSEISPIKKNEDSPVSLKQQEYLHSFKKDDSQQRIMVPRINLEALRLNQEPSSPIIICKAIKKRPKQLSYCEKQSFYDKSSLMNMISKSRETKDTDNRRSDSNSRARNQTFHTGQPQSLFLKDLIDRVHKQNNIQNNPQPKVVNQKYKISDFEKKQLTLLIGKYKKKQCEQVSNI